MKIKINQNTSNYIECDNCKYCVRLIATSITKIYFIMMIQAHLAMNV